MAEEIKNQGQQEYAENISGQAKEIISAALEETKNNGTSPVLGDPNVTDNFKVQETPESISRIIDDFVKNI